MQIFAIGFFVSWIINFFIAKKPNKISLLNDLMKLLIKIIEWYQRNISAWLDYKNIKCKYYPTCSEYTIEALEKYGTIKGLFLGFKRIIKCNPFSKGGIDLLK